MNLVYQGEFRKSSTLKFKMKFETTHIWRFIEKRFLDLITFAIQNTPLQFTFIKHWIMKLKIVQSLFHVGISLVQFTDRMMGHVVRLRNPDTLLLLRRD